MSRHACLLIHGFTGGPHEVTPLADHLGTTGHAVHVMTLPGHEVQPPELKLIHWTQWVEAAEEEARRMAEEYGRFDLVGFSMGGLIASHLACRYPVGKLVLLNAAVYYASPRSFVKDTASKIKRKDWSFLHKINGTPLRATMNFMKLVRSLKPSFSAIDIPTLIVQSGQDQIVHPRSANYLERTIKSDKRVLLFPDSGHVICRGSEAERLFDEVARFLNEPVMARKDDWELS